MAALLAAVTMAGCSGDGESTAKEKPKFSAATESPSVFIERMANLLATTAKKEDCAQLEEINARSYFRFSCPPAKELRTSMAKFEVVGAAEYGTGAVVDYRSGKIKDGATILLFVGPDRNWGISRFGIVTKPSTKTSDEDARDHYAAAVDDYLDAVRDRDCEAFKKVAFTGDIKDSEVCKGKFAATEDLAKRLKASPNAEPRYEGGNGQYGFFTFESQKPLPSNSTISVVKAADGADESYVILDVTPTPTAAEQRRVRTQLRQQQKKGNPATKEPSSKPSDPAVTAP